MERVVHAIPLNITDIMDWGRPAEFADDRIHGGLVLMFEVAVILPALAYATHIFQDRVGFQNAATVVGADNPLTSCDLHVFVDEAAEPVSS